MALLGTLLLSGGCTAAGAERDSLAARIPLFALADPLRQGEHFPIFSPLMPDENPVVGAEAVLVLAATGEEPVALLAAVPDGGSAIERWLSQADGLGPSEASEVLAAARAAGHQPSTADTEVYARHARTAIESGEPSGLFYASWIARDLAAAAGGAGADILAGVRDELGPACERSGLGNPAGDPLQRLSNLSLILAAASAAGHSCQPPGAAALLALASTEAGLAQLSTEGRELELAAILARLVSAGSLAAEGDVRDHIETAIDGLTSPSAHGNGQQCVLILLLVAGESAHALGDELRLARPVRECVHRTLQWRGRLPDIIADYDVLASVYGVRAIEYYETLTGSRDAGALRDSARDRLDPTSPGTEYDRVVLGVAFDPESVTSNDLDSFARRTLTSNIPVHIGLVAVASTNPDLCTGTVRDALRDHVVRVDSELDKAAAAGNLPYVYWANVLLKYAEGCAAHPAATVALARLRDHVAGLFAVPRVFGAGTDLSDPSLAAYGWDAACELGLDAQVRPHRDQARTALISWLPSQPDAYTRPAFDLPRLYSLLRLTYLVEVGCGPDDSIRSMWRDP
jgi:hypothetical protein